jgi:hypothetical protein
VTRRLKLPHVLALMAVATMVVAGGLTWNLLHRQEKPWTMPKAPVGTSPIEIAKPNTYWTAENGFVEMVSPIRLPVSRRENSRIQIFLRLPKGTLLESEGDPNGDGQTLNYPAGTVADRVESLQSRNQSETYWTVADVRGAEVLEEGQLFHVYRPVVAGADKPLFGYAWRKADRVANQAAHETIGIAMSTQGAGFARPQKSKKLPKRIQAFKNLSGCADCHQLNRVPRQRADEATPFRGSDAGGFFGIRTVLENEGPIESYRPRDVNHVSPYISIKCPQDIAAEKISDEKGSVRFTCPDHGIPRAVFDMITARKNGDLHAEKVCRSRQYLHGHLTDAARRPFEERFQECGIGGDNQPAAGK